MKKFTVILFICILSGAIALPLTASNSDSESLSTLTDRSKPSDVLVPIHSGAVIGEIVVGSGPVSVNRARPAPPKRENEPSFSRFISEGPEPEIKFSSGSKVENHDSGKAPKQIDGATIVFNNEAAIQEIV